MSASQTGAGGDDFAVPDLRERRIHAGRGQSVRLEIFISRGECARAPVPSELAAPAALHARGDYPGHTRPSIRPRGRAGGGLAKR